jgi:mannose-6-phosphate isomerase-like protein (cupin superfamily)
MVEPPTSLELVCADFDAALPLLCDLGMRLDVIWPADEPHSAILSRDGDIVYLTSRPDAPRPYAALPEFRPEFVATHAGTASSEGRAGMQYRDLIRGRLGGRYIASHIMIAEGGPVADWVHYHRVAFQLICVRSGWVRVVYQDQGEPFVMTAGDMVLQPPGIRHRVLESSAGLEVVEISCPALHETFADHEMALPGGEAGAAADFGGQKFVRHVAATAKWTEWNGGEAQKTAVSAATGGMAGARLVRRGSGESIAVPAHEGELVFGFVLDGSARLEHGGGELVGPADAYVIPPGEGWGLFEMSEDFLLLHVTTGEIAQY